MTTPSQATLSRAQGAKIQLLSQGIGPRNPFGQGKQGTLNAINHLGYCQIDSVSVVQRAHHHTLWNRVKNYQPEHLDQLVEEKQLFEYWSHAAAYLPINDFRYSLIRKQAVISGGKHWFEKDPHIAQQILQRIRAEGPLQAKDFDQANHKNSGWFDWKPAKIALEQLYIEGELMVVKRHHFQKVYDLTERVLPSHIDTSTPTTSEYCDHLIYRYLNANGIGTIEQMAYLLKGIKAPLKLRCQQLLEDQQLICLTIDQQSYFALPTVFALLDQKWPKKTVKILSPFDNLVIQRKRLQTLFNYHYQIECYLPAAKRQYGYFCLPLLWGQQFIGRVDIKMNRQNQTLQIQSLHFDQTQYRQSTFNKTALQTALQQALTDFAEFNHAKRIEWHTDIKLKVDH